MLGAFRRGDGLGFTLAIAGVRNRRPFLHSHMMRSDSSTANEGVGPGAQLLQRQEALGRGSI